MQNIVKFQALTVASLKMVIFWVIAAYNQVDVLEVLVLET